jgi:hypothetical protein
MKYHLGALHKVTKKYTSPFEAARNETYICPDSLCGRDLILKKGTVRVPHFAHFHETDPCVYYSHPSESQMHREAKMLMKNILEYRNRHFEFTRKCKCCRKELIYELDLTDLVVECEWGFIFQQNQKYADVACLNPDKSIYIIIEIFHTHQTQEQDRPEPWFEVKADYLLSLFASKSPGEEIPIKIECCRRDICDDCREKLRDFNLHLSNDEIMRKNNCFQCTGNGIYSRKTDEQPKLCIDCTCCSSSSKACIECLMLNKICAEVKQLLKKLEDVNYLCIRLKLKRKNLDMDFDLNKAYTCPILWFERDCFKKTMQMLCDQEKDLSCKLTSELTKELTKELTSELLS